jgi:thiamine-phosphate pyrophosphorylase
MTVPCVAVGGITVENGGPLAKIGADFVAVCAGVWQHPERPVAAVAQFQHLLHPSAGTLNEA